MVLEEGTGSSLEGEVRDRHSPPSVLMEESASILLFFLHQLLAGIWKFQLPEPSP